LIVRMLAAILNYNKGEKGNFMVVFTIYFGLRKVSNKQLCPWHPLRSSPSVYF